MTTIVANIILFIINGMVIGSFLSICIYRIQKKISIVRGLPYCPLCNHSLQIKDLVPVVSYIFLKGKCRYCKDSISFRYIAVEILTGGLFGLAFITFQSFYALLISLFFSVLVIVSFIDLDTGEIPDRLHVFILVFTVLNIIASRVIPDYAVVLPLSSYIIGFFAVSIPMLAIAYFTDGFGGGDIKLMAVSGLFLGWQSIVFAFMISSCLGGFYGVYLMIMKKAKMKTTFSFGAHLSIGIVISTLIG